MHMETCSTSKTWPSNRPFSEMVSRRKMRGYSSPLAAANSSAFWDRSMMTCSDSGEPGLGYTCPSCIYMARSVQLSATLHWMHSQCLSLKVQGRGVQCMCGRGNASQRGPGMRTIDYQHGLLTIDMLHLVHNLAHRPGLTPCMLC